MGWLMTLFVILGITSLVFSFNRCLCHCNYNNDSDFSLTIMAAFLFSFFIFAVIILQYYQIFDHYYGLVHSGNKYISWGLTDEETKNKHLLELSRLKFNLSILPCFLYFISLGSLTTSGVLYFSCQRYYSQPKNFHTWMSSSFWIGVGFLGLAIVATLFVVVYFYAKQLFHF